MALMPNNEKFCTTNDLHERQIGWIGYLLGTAEWVLFYCLLIGLANADSLWEIDLSLGRSHESPKEYFTLYFQPPWF